MPNFIVNEGDAPLPSVAFPSVSEVAEKVQKVEAELEKQEATPPVESPPAPAPVPPATPTEPKAAEYEVLPSGEWRFKANGELITRKPEALLNDWRHQADSKRLKDEAASEVARYKAEVEKTRADAASSVETRTNDQVAKLLQDAGFSLDAQGKLVYPNAGGQPAAPTGPEFKIEGIDETDPYFVPLKSLTEQMRSALSGVSRAPQSQDILRELASIKEQVASREQHERAAAEATVWEGWKSNTDKKIREIAAQHPLLKVQPDLLDDTEAGVNTSIARAFTDRVKETKSLQIDDGWAADIVRSKLDAYQARLDRHFAARQAQIQSAPRPPVATGGGTPASPAPEKSNRDGRPTFAAAAEAARARVLAAQSEE